MTATPDPRKVNLYARSDGNASRHVIKVATSSQGAGDQIELMPLIPGMEVDRVEVVVTDAGTNPVDIGFAGPAGNDVDYFVDGQAINAVGRFAGVAAPRRTLVNDEMMTLNFTGAEAAALEFYVLVDFRFPGNL